jgi:hypothetical protein
MGNSIPLVVLALFFVGFFLYQVRKWKDLEPMSRKAIYVGIGTALSAAVIAIIDPPWAGRWLFLVLIIGFAAYWVLFYGGMKKHGNTLNTYGLETEMSVVRNKEEERNNADMAWLRKWLEPDVYDFKVGGEYPALVQNRDPWVLVVRIPTAKGVLDIVPESEFDFGTPNFTAFSYVRKIPVSRVMLSKQSLAANPPKKIFTTGDDDFDKLFYLTGVSQNEAQQIFTPEVISWFKEHHYSIGWVRVERFGIYCFRNGIVESREDILDGISLLELIAEAIDQAIEKDTLRPPGYLTT